MTTKDQHWHKNVLKLFAIEKVIDFEITYNKMIWLFWFNFEFSSNVFYCLSYIWLIIFKLTEIIFCFGKSNSKAFYMYRDYAPASTILLTRWVLIVSEKSPKKYVPSLY